MSKAKTYELEGNDKVIADSICDQMGLPRIPEKCVFNFSDFDSVPTDFNLKIFSAYK